MVSAQMMKQRKNKDADKPDRIALINSEKCKPKLCRQECKRHCPVVISGKQCVIVNPSDTKAFISEQLCIGCGICIKKCPMDAISIINLPSSLAKDTTHRFGANTFKLHRLPTPRLGEVLGLVGTNGIGKSTALKILSGQLKPNLGRISNPPDWQEILTFFRGSELQNYFTRLLENDISPQYVDQIPKLVKGTVKEILKEKDKNNRFDTVVEDYELGNLLDHSIDKLSGGELQRFTCAVTSIQEKDIYMFDEPSSYLDVRQRLKVAQNIRKIAANKKYVIVVEHDLSILDYLSDYICVLYGVASAYGVVTLPYTVKEGSHFFYFGINVFLDGFIPTENLRFRQYSLVFKFLESIDNSSKSGSTIMSYPQMEKKYKTFELKVAAGSFSSPEIIVLLGENGTGKTTFIRMLYEYFSPEELTDKRLVVSYKPQKISPRSEDTVKVLLLKKISESMNNPQFMTDIVKPLQLECIYDQNIKNLSGGELQRVALALCLGKPADIYLLDEPSAYLDSEQRINSSKIIKHFIFHTKKTAFVVEHDFIMATYLADRVILFNGTPSIKASAEAPQPMLIGVNQFLKQMQISFRRDKTNFRPRINKTESVKDIQQKSSGQYFFTEEN